MLKTGTEVTTCEPVSLTLEAYSTVEIPLSQHQNLIACQTMLDMILTSIKDNTGFADSAVLKCAKEVRAMMMGTLIFQKEICDE